MSQLKSSSYQPLFELFGRFHQLSDPLKLKIQQKTEIITVKKKQKLLNQGQKSNQIYFILEGALRIFYLNKQGIEINTWFLFENELAISVYSFFTGEPSFEHIEALEDCTLISLNKQQLDALYQEFLEFNIIGRKLTELYYIRNEAEANALRMFPAKDRYTQLITNQPQVFKRVSLGYIASYLGISQETLSRIRKQY